MAFVRAGWLMVGRVRDRSFRRLVRGTAPAWSPNGKWIAFIDKGHRLSVVPAKGGRVRRIGAVTGTTVDWQPLPASPPAACQTPPGSTVLASNDTATLSADSSGGAGLDGGSSQAVMFCLRADGRERVLDFEPAPLTGLSLRQGVVAGPYAALLADGGARYGITFITVKLYDLRTARELANREISTGCPCEGQTSGDQLVLGSDGVMAIHTTAGPLEQIQASDSTGTHALDSVSRTDGSLTLTNLTLTGDTLTWEHNGTPRSTQLQP